MSAFVFLCISIHIHCSANISLYWLEMGTNVLNWIHVCLYVLYFHFSLICIFVHVSFCISGYLYSHSLQRQYFLVLMGEAGAGKEAISLSGLFPQSSLMTGIIPSYHWWLEKWPVIIDDWRNDQSSLLVPLGKPHWESCRVYSGIAQIAIAPSALHSNGHSGALYFRADLSKSFNAIWTSIFTA